LLALVLVVDAAVSGGVFGDLAGVVAGMYLAAVGIASCAAGLRHQSVLVGALTALGIVLTHLAYSAGLARGLVR
jgi:hypothetical protein